MCSAKTRILIGIEQQGCLYNRRGDHPGTFQGNSEMPLRNSSGNNIGIAKGDGGPGQGSSLNAGMSTYRAATGLQVALINP